MSAEVLDQLAAALANEHRALLERDAQGLLHAGQLKLAALQELESSPPDAEEQRLSELAEANRMNGALLARRRHEVDLTLRQLGQDDTPTGYDAQGLSHKKPPQRVLAVV